MGWGRILLPDENCVAGITLYKVGVDLLHLQDPHCFPVHVLHILHTQRKHL